MSVSTINGRTTVLPPQTLGSSGTARYRLQALLDVVWQCETIEVRDGSLTGTLLARFRTSTGNWETKGDRDEGVSLSDATATNPVESIGTVSNELRLKARTIVIAIKNNLRFQDGTGSPKLQTLQSSQDTKTSGQYRAGYIFT